MRWLYEMHIAGLCLDNALAQATQTGLYDPLHWSRLQPILLLVNALAALQAY